jgi:pantoate kinase
MDGVAVARSPGHISGYFRRILGDTAQATGSCGGGIVIEEGVLARAGPSRSPAVRMIFPGSRPIAGGPPLIESAMERLGVSAEVTTESTLPAGAGFGLSAAALLASISALSALFDLRLSDREIASLAHEIEVIHRTGLGDVAACQGGGIECRKGPGIWAEIDRIPDPGRVIHAVSFGPIPTPQVLGDPARMERIDHAFPGRCPRDLGDLFSLSRDFVERSGLVTPRVREVLAPVLSSFGEVFRLRIAGRGFTRGEVIG